MMKTTTTTSTMEPQIQDQMLLFTQIYPDIYAQIIPQQGETKRRNRRKKNRGESKSSGVKKRKLTAEQVRFLEINFGSEHKLESERKDRIASELGLDPRQVAVWFQNRRARWKNKKMEDEYSKLKKNHDTVVVEKCRLESEVIKLKEKLSEAEMEIQRLSERSEGNSSNSPSSSLSMEAMDAPFLGEYGIEGYEEDVLYMPENDYVNYMEWINQYM